MFSTSDFPMSSGIDPFARPSIKEILERGLSPDEIGQLMQEGFLHNRSKNVNFSPNILNDAVNLLWKEAVYWLLMNTMTSATLIRNPLVRAELIKQLLPFAPAQPGSALPSENYLRRGGAFFIPGPQQSHTAPALLETGQAGDLSIDFPPVTNLHKSFGV